MQTLSTKVRLNDYFKTFKRPSAHSKFSPSSADRWLKTGCSFSVGFIDSVKPEEEDSKYSIEGTLAHSYCEAIFRLEYYGMQVPFNLAMDLAQLDDCGEEMHQAAQDYVEVVSTWIEDTQNIGEVIFMGQEQAVPVFDEKSCFGTADFLIVGSQGAVIIDFKYGKGKNVQATTPQLKVYAAGLARFLEGVSNDYKVHIVIHQPRVVDMIKTHSYTIGELREFLVEIWDSIIASERRDLQPVEGNHCFWCPGRRTKDPNKKCPAIAGKPIKLANEAFDQFFADMAGPADSLAPQKSDKRDAAILKLHALYPLIKETVERTTEEIEWRIKNGEVVQGFTLKDHFGNRTIMGDKPEDRAKLIKSKWPEVNPWKEVPATKKLKALTELEKEIGKQNINTICVKKVSKKIEVLDDRAQKILGELTVFAQMLNNNGQEE